MNDSSTGADSPLVSGEWLSAHLDDPDVRIIEVTAKDEEPDYDGGHIPGAVWWYWKDAVWHETDREFPSPEEMAARLGRIGVGPGTDGRPLRRPGSVRDVCLLGVDDVRGAESEAPGRWPEGLARGGEAA